MYSHYPQDIRLWLANKGGVDRMPYFGMWKLEAAELWEMGYRKCEPEPLVPMTILRVQTMPQWMHANSKVPITKSTSQQYRSKWETAVEVEEREREYWRKKDEAYRRWIEVHK